MESSAVHHTGAAAGLHGRSPLLRLQSDERLIALIRRGNQHAFEALVARYQSRLLAFCRHMLTSKEDAEDVLQEVFAAAYQRDPRGRARDQRAPVAVPDRAQPLAQPPAPRDRRRRGLDGRAPLRGRPDDRRQGAQARGVPAPDRRRAGSSRDAAHRAAAARDRRALLRADRRGDGDHGPVGQVAARARAGLARRGRPGAAALLRRGPRRARRRRRGPGAHDRARPPAPAHMRPLHELPQAAALQQPRDGRPVSRRPAVPAQEDDPGPARRRLGRLGRHGRRRRRRAASPPAARCRPA